MLSKKFISATKERNTLLKHVAAPLMRKNFILKEIPDELIITVCGLGFYDIFINGEKITKGILAPYISNPDHICYYDKYDLFVGMDSYNIRNMHRIFGNDPHDKIHKLMDYTDRHGDVSDPWYTRDFNVAYQDIYDGCKALLEQLQV